jgi:hypothetical protein
MGLEKNSSTKRLPRITLWNVFETRLRQLPLTLCWPNFLLPKVSWIPRFVGKNRVNTNIFAGHTYIYTRMLYNIIYIHVCYIIIYIYMYLYNYIYMYLYMYIYIAISCCFIGEFISNWLLYPAHPSWCDVTLGTCAFFTFFWLVTSIWAMSSWWLRLVSTKFSRDFRAVGVSENGVYNIYIYVYVYYMNIKYTHLVYIHIIYTQFLAIWYDLLGGF